MRSFINFLLAVPAVLAAPVVLETRQADRILGSWIVRVNQDSVLSDVISQVTSAAGAGATSKHTYDFGGFKGFSIDGVSDLTSVVANIASIQSIEQNTIVRTSALVTQQNVPSYGLARISHRKNGATDYVYDSSAGEGTYAYIIDTVRAIPLILPCQQPTNLYRASGPHTSISAAAPSSVPAS